MALRRRLGKYRLVKELAVGGMAEVYLAVAEGLSGFEKRVVVKRLLPQHGADAELVAMFLDEARLLATLKHPNIAEIYDVGQEGGDYFFAMEHVPGRDLRDVLQAHGGEPLPLPEAIAVVLGVARGLGHAHEQGDAAGRAMGIVHRDVSPSNVLISREGQVKLIDFGVAKWSAQRSETRHGVLKGKCAYMSPEQCRAESLDCRSDVFSLGVLLYELTTGQRPFAGASDFEVLNAIVKGEMQPPSRRRPGYPPELEAIVMRALRADREQRYPTARDLALELEAFAAGRQLATDPAGLAALLVALFGGEEAQEAWNAAEETSAPSAPAPAAAPRAAIDRTATDHSAAPPPVRRQARKRARIGAAVLVAVGVATAAIWLSGESRRARSAAPVPAPVARPIADPAPPVNLPEVNQARTAAAPVTSPESDASKTTKKPARRSAARPPGVKVWDPDSPTLP